MLDTLGHRGHILSGNPGEESRQRDSCDSKKWQRQPSVFCALVGKTNTTVGEGKQDVSCCGTPVYGQAASSLRAGERHAEGWSCTWPGFVRTHSRFSGRRPVIDSSRQVWRVLIQPHQPASSPRRQRPRLWQALTGRSDPGED